MDMATSQVMHKDPIMGLHYLPYVETRMIGFGRYLWWVFYMNFIIILITTILIFLAIIFLKKVRFSKTKLELDLPYIKKEYLMTKAEHEFFKVLEQVVDGKYYIVPQVQLSNLVKVKKSKSWKYSYHNKIDRKSVDFVLFNKEYFTPHLVIELDDSSHLRSDRETRDGFVNEVLNKVGLKIVHIKNAYNYDLKNISDTIN